MPEASTKPTSTKPAPSAGAAAERAEAAAARAEAASARRRGPSRSRRSSPRASRAPTVSSGALDPHTAIVTSALIVFSAWGYRKLIEPVSTAAKGEPEHNSSTVTAFLGAGKTPANSAQFAVGFGFTYVSLAILSTFAPEPAAAFAWVVAAGVVLINGSKLFEDVTHQVSTSTTTTATTTKAKK